MAFILQNYEPKQTLAASIAFVSYLTTATGEAAEVAVLMPL